MGYSDVGVTLNVYTHASYDRAVEQMAKILDFKETDMHGKQLWHNKDKSENPCGATGWLVCPYSFSTNFPAKNRHNEGCQKVRRIYYTRTAAFVTPFFQVF